MYQMLKPRQTVRTAASALVCEVQRFLGGGGQGEVYQAQLGGKPVALKWYFPHAATPEQRATLAMLIKQGPPSSTFLWPRELVSEPGVPGFGYVMPLRPPHYRGLVELMKRRVEPSFRALATAGLELADSFLQLHARGLCYRDINFGNVFFEPETGEVLICDNDNVAIDGETQGGILGTPRFMAPEVVRGEALASTHTDLFSLAVLLFYMFMMHHPLEGRQEAAIRSLDLPAMLQLYGTAPVFIFDPDDRSNTPVPGYHDNALAFWPIYPQFFRQLFTRAFTVGLRDPYNGRVRESEWRIAMVRLRDAIVYCPRGEENFYCADTFQARQGKLSPCWSCQQAIALPPRLHLGKHVVMLNHDTQLYPHHIDATRMYDFSQPVAAVTPHPTRQNVWGLKNISTSKWDIATSDGTVRDVAPGYSVTLAVGTTIHFGNTDGEIGL